MNTADIEAIIRNATVCRLGLLDEDIPYVVPLCFGYRDGVLYFHTSPKSRKLEMIRKHPKVCFEMDILVDPFPAEKPCDWNMRYQSVIGFGTASIIQDAAEKRAALSIIVNQYASGTHDLPEKKVAITAVFKVAVDRMTGRQSKIGDA